MKFVRKLEKKELTELADFMIEQFFEKEEFQQMFRGLDQEEMKVFAKQLLFHDLSYFFQYGDIFVIGDPIVAAIVGIESKKIASFHRLRFALRGNQELKRLSKEQLQILKSNLKPIQEVHTIKWFKKYCKNAYCLLQFAVLKSERGKGLARQMLSSLMKEVKQDIIVLETLTEDNVAIYEHFGFTVKEISKSSNQELTEYRMLLKKGTTW